MLLLGDSPASEFHMPTFRNTLSHLHRQEGACRRTYLPMKVEQAECSETSVYEFKTPGNHPKGSIQHSGHGESLKSRIHPMSSQLYLICLSTCMHYWSFAGPPLWSSGQSFWLQIQRSRVRFPALPDFLSSSGSGKGSTQPREVNWGATWIKK